MTIEEKLRYSALQGFVNLNNIEYNKNEHQIIIDNLIELKRLEIGYINDKKYFIQYIKKCSSNQLNYFKNIIEEEINKNKNPKITKNNKIWVEILNLIKNKE